MSAVWAASLRECEDERDAAYRERDRLRADDRVLEARKGKR